jgi:D-3-phosphoglycerate dehydrogenase / 2-oxoglutarate reductase
VKIVIPDDYQDAVRTLDCFDKLAEHDVTLYHDSVKDIDVLTERFHPADALVLIRERTTITAQLLQRLPNLKLISQTGRGTTHIDLDACQRQGVTVCAGGGSPYATAELTWALIMASMRHIPQEVARLKNGQWQTTLGRGLRGRTLGIYGYGGIGTLVAGYGRAFGMRVVVWGREGSLTRAQTDGFEIAQNKESLFAESDVLSVHIKLNDATRAIITENDLIQMKPSALFVNTSRAGLVEDGALVRALQAGRPGFAAVDIYEEEPVTDHPLLQMDNVICTPHLGYVEKDGYEQYFGEAFDQVLAFAAGTPVNVVR